MLRLKKILFPTDFSDCSERAFSHAALIASQLNAEIHAFHTRVRHSDEYPALQHLLDEVDDFDGDDEQTLDFPETNHDLVIQADATDSSPCNAILSYTKEHDIDLIVMGSHGRRGPKRLFLGSTAECVIRNAECPVLTLRSDAESLHSENLSNILVPVDFSEYAEEALRYTNELAKLWNAKVTLVHAVEQAILPTVYGIEPMAISSQEPLLEKSDIELKNLAKQFLDESIEVNTHTLLGPPTAVISDYAKENNIDLIIMASHGLTGLKRFLLGSVAESMNRQVSCAVLTVKPFGKSLVKDESLQEAETSS